ncbi:hypothetical protein HanRHA438_Chr15g0716211 [Helianthus annuus]|nr:hypothetical protein HanRHA438_Chr15g0716211 [Helianthus annuus]
MDKGTPCNETFSSIYSLAKRFILKVSFIGKKCADLVKHPQSPNCVVTFSCFG